CMTLYEELNARGHIYQVSNESVASYINEPRTIYLGTDPTADSLHVGHLAVFMLLKRLKQAGHNVVVLLGGATGMIGDPSGKSDERNLLTTEQVAQNAVALKKQITTLFGDGHFDMVNNYDWTQPVSTIEFLRDIGKYFSVHTLLGRESIKNRLESENFFSYTEFSYSLLQAYDFWYLFKNKNCTVQVGASDQWGNMVAGIELVHKKEGADVYVITAPLVVDPKTGKKFGKSEGGAVWLDATKTSPYMFYQFWLSTPDEGVEQFLKVYTDFTLDEIAKIVSEHSTNPSLRIGQKKLAIAVTEMVHGKEKANASEEVSSALFGTNIELSNDAIKMIEQEVFGIEGESSDIVDILVETKLATSKRDARTLVEQGSVYVGGQKVSESANIDTYPQTSGLYIIKKGNNFVW
ncbi:MAG: tyrosine--tRNA ligase, partial [Minisyncoccia bacterium]